MKIGLKKPFFTADGGGEGGVNDSTDPGADGQIIDANGVNDNIEGLKNKNKELLGKLKASSDKLKKFEDAVEAEKLKLLEDEGKFKELNEANQAKIDTLQSRLRKKEMTLMAKDFINPKSIKLFEDEIEFDEDGNITNADEVLTRAKESDPYLFKSDSESIPGTFKGKPAGYTPAKGKFSIEEIERMTPDEYKKNQAEINKQVASL